MVNTREICSAAVPWLNHNRGNEVVGAVGALTVLATTAVVLRFLARHMTRTSYGLDDWLMLFALVSASSLAVRRPLTVGLPDLAVWTVISISLW